VGATLQSFVVRTSDYEEIKTRLLRWVSAKGFEPVTGPALFELDPDEERGLCLFSKGSRVVVLYSHVFQEGERLRFELTRPEWPLLKVWVYDSDVWGYRLFDDGVPTSDFCSNPRYFGHWGEEDLPPGVTDDPELLCRALDLGPVEGTIAALQRKRAVFKEFVCRKFCQAIGAEPACHDYRDLDGLPSPLSATAVGWRIDHFRFAERGGSARESVQPLHAMVRKPLEQQDPAALQAAAELHASLWPLRALGWTIRFVMVPLVVVLGLALRLIFWFQRLPFVRRRYERSLGPEHALFVALEELQRPVVRREGADLINENHRCRITLPAGADAADGPTHTGWVFQLKVAGRDALCAAIRPRALRGRLREMPGTEITGEECFFAGTLQARAWSATVRHGQSFTEHYTLVVQTPRAFYHFSLGDREPLAEDAKRVLRAVGESFRTF
jgi:hypothetical protein